MRKAKQPAAITAAEFPKWTDAQTDAYIASIETLLTERAQYNSLISSFDLIAGAMMVFFVNGQQNRIPAKWVFATVRDGLIPHGVGEQIESLHRLARDADAVLGDMDNLQDTIDELSKSAAIMQREMIAAMGKINAMLKSADKVLASTNKDVATRP